MSPSPFRGTSHTPLSAVTLQRGPKSQLRSALSLVCSPSAMANTTAPSPGSALPSCLHSSPSFCSTSSDEETDNLQWPTCFRTHIHPDWMIKGVTSVKRRRIPVRHDALLIRLLPVFLPPREAPHHRDFVNLPLEGSSCLLPVNTHTGHPVAPTFWARLVPTCRISPQDPSVTRLIIWLLNWQFEEWVATWGYIPDFLFKWEEPRRRLTVFPLVSVLLEPHFPHQTAFDLAVSTTYPIINALQTPPHLNKFEVLDIAPLLCFLLGQWCQFETIQSFSYSKEVWRMVLPGSLEQQHWQYIQRVNDHWRTLYRSPSLDTSLCDFISHIIDTRAAEFTTTTHTEHQSQPLLLSDWQVVPPCHIQISYSLYGLCGMRLLCHGTVLHVSPTSLPCCSLGGASSSHPVIYDLLVPSSTWLSLDDLQGFPYTPGDLRSPSHFSITTCAPPRRTLYYHVHPMFQ